MSPKKESPKKPYLSMKPWVTGLVVEWAGLPYPVRQTSHPVRINNRRLWAKEKRQRIYIYIF